MHFRFVLSANRATPTGAIRPLVSACKSHAAQVSNELHYHRYKNHLNTGKKRSSGGAGSFDDFYGSWMGSDVSRFAQQTGGNQNPFGGFVSMPVADRKYRPGVNDDFLAATAAFPDAVLDVLQPGFCSHSNEIVF
jgi:hypothetical protein